MSKKKSYKELLDYDWLYDNYIIKMRSSIDIAKELGCDFSTVIKRLRFHNIKVRDKSLAHTINRESDNFKLNLSVINGCLLGDGCITVGNLRKNASTNISKPYFTKKNIHLDHIMYVGSLLFDSDLEKRITLTKAHRTIIKERECNCKDIYTLQSLTHDFLLPVFNDWYPSYNNYKKIIPRNLKIDKHVLLHWFLDDGYSYYVNRKYKSHEKTIIRIQFATQCFNYDDLKFLSQLCYNTFGLKIVPRLHRRNGISYGYFMELSESQYEKFYEIIGPPPVESLAYKWKSIKLNG